MSEVIATGVDQWAEVADSDFAFSVEVTVGCVSGREASLTTTPLFASVKEAEAFIRSWTDHCATWVWGPLMAIGRRYVTGYIVPFDSQLGAQHDQVIEYGSRNSTATPFWT